MARSDETLLNLLRSRTKVIFDSLNCDAASSLGPFEGCTSNQAIAYAELQKSENQGLIACAAKYAAQMLDGGSSTPTPGVVPMTKAQLTVHLSVCGKSLGVGLFSTAKSSRLWRSQHKSLRRSRAIFISK